MSRPLFVQHVYHWLKHDPSPIARNLLRVAKSLRTLDFPAPKILFGPIAAIYLWMRGLLEALLRVVVWTPMFKSRLARVGKGLYLYGGLPYTSGPLYWTVGDRCRISGRITVTGRVHSSQTPTFEIGDNVDLGWMTTVAVGRRVVLGDNVRLAGQCFLAGYPGHPLDARSRAQGLPETDAQVGDVILERDVWLGTGVSVMAGVTIGEATVVGAGSVVTRDLPPNVLAAGNPARVIRSLVQSNKAD